MGLPPIRAESVLMVLTKGCPGSTGSGWSVRREKKKSLNIQGKKIFELLKQNLVFCCCLTVVMPFCHVFTRGGNEPKKMFNEQLTKIWTHRFVVGRKRRQVSACSSPDKEFMVSSAVGLTGEDEPQLDWANGPVTLTRLSGCSRAAFTGVMELKRTPDRQPVNPREANPTKSVSSSDSNSRKKHRWRSNQQVQFTPI